MTSNHLESKLRRAINEAIANAPDPKPKALADYVSREHANLVAELYQAWGTERLIARCAAAIQLGSRNPMKRGRVETHRTRYRE